VVNSSEERFGRIFFTGKRYRGVVAVYNIPASTVTVSPLCPAIRRQRFSVLKREREDYRFVNSGLKRLLTRGR
jgi:hypothetical protein